MKIYNEVVSRFNEKTNKWETISEDSFNYEGDVALAQGIPPNASSINTSDTIADTIKTTTGYFTDGDGTLEGINIHTGSLSSDNEKYYFNINHKASTDSTSQTQFAVSFGHIAGSGSNTYGDSDDPGTLKGETQAIYKQFAEMLLLDTEASGGFKISANGSSGKLNATNASDEYIYILVGKRARFKDRMNKKSWTLNLSGSNTTGSGVSLSLTDDSKNIPAVATPGGPRYNIVAGELGVPTTPAATRTYGWFYPEMGVMIFSGCELSASIPGGPHYTYTDKITKDNTVSKISNFAAAGFGCKHYLSGSNDAGSALAAQAGYAFIPNGAMVKFISGSIPALGERTFQVSASTHGIHTAALTASLPLTESFAGWGGIKLGKFATGSLQLGMPTNRITASWGPFVGGKVNNVIASASGFAPNLDAKGNPQNALRLANCMTQMSSSVSLRLRSEEDQTQENYFCRIKAEEYNFSSNHTFVSGSKNKIRNADMHGNPQTFITGVGLYNSSGQLLAIAKLSKPLKKNFASEATIKAKLTY